MPQCQRATWWLPLDTNGHLAQSPTIFSSPFPLTKSTPRQKLQGFLHHPGVPAVWQLNQSKGLIKRLPRPLTPHLPPRTLFATPRKNTAPRRGHLLLSARHCQPLRDFRAEDPGRNLFVDLPGTLGAFARKAEFRSHVRTFSVIRPRH